MADWFGYAYQINKAERDVLIGLIDTHRPFMLSSSEDELNMKFLVPLLNTVHFHENGIRDWYQRLVKGDDESGHRKREETIMLTDEYITIRVKPEIKDKAQAILKDMGMSTSEAIDLFLTYIVLRKNFPSELHIPNTTTLKTFQDSESGKNMKTCATLDELYQDLGI